MTNVFETKKKFEIVKNICIRPIDHINLFTQEKKSN